MLFTTSWDDGNALDLKTAALLDRYGCKGTFYVCPKLSTLSREQIRLLNDRHEVGAHTMTHPYLTTVSREQAVKEIRDSKQWIEEITGQECRMFCYPFGAENSEVEALVRSAGFAGARTIEQIRFEAGSNPWALPTSLHIYPFPWRRRWTKWRDVFDPLNRWRLLRPALKGLELPAGAYRGWLPLAKALFLSALKRDKPLFHLWGHSEEVGRFRMWRDLERFLEFVSNQKKVLHVTNGRLV